MIEGLTKDFFIGNRERLLEQLGEDALVALTANGALQRSEDTTLPFTQDKNFWYMTGTAVPDAVLVFDRQTSFIILPQSNAVKDIFDGAVDTNLVCAQSGVQEVLTAQTGWLRLKSMARQRNRLYTLLPAASYDLYHGFYRNPARHRFAQRLRRVFPGKELSDISEAITRLRTYKQPSEIALISKAVSVTTAAIDSIRRADILRTFSFEYELEAAMSYEFRKAGAFGHAYSPIVAAGVNATTLHYITNDSKIGTNDLVVLDVGAELGQYAADITRTLTKASPSARQQAVLNAVHEVQQYALSLLRPGVYLRDYEKKVLLRMGEVLLSLGLITDSSDMVAIRRYYPHATSHFLGLDVHDVGFYSEPLAEGMVLTCEPGIYIPEEGIGVRLEDDICITKTGMQNLSEDCSYDAYVI